MGDRGFTCVKTSFHSRFIKASVVLGIIIANLLLTLQDKIDKDASGTAHCAGGVVGVLAGILMIRNRKTVPWEIKLWKTTLVISILLFLGFICAIAVQ